jgi:hypothetical protein
MLQPPLSIGSRLARQATTLLHSSVCRSTFIPIFCSTSVDLVQVFETARDLDTSPAIGVSGTHSPTSVVVRLDRHQRRRS